jgi:hypothetical protein
LILFVKGTTLSKSKIWEPEPVSGVYFSNTYAEARRRFIDFSVKIGATLNSYEVDCGDQDDELAMDVALLGPSDAPTIVVSSGVHGVEAFFGSAVQLALLEQLDRATDESNLRYVLIHAVNPFGFAKIRRFNEDNVDLNRNFLSRVSDYRGAPEGYAELDKFLNPASPPSRFEPFKLRALRSIWRHGRQALKQSVAGGQYEYPRGLFFGGRGPSKSTRLVQQNCDSWIGLAEKIVHIDFHSGLGSFGSYKLLVAEEAGADSVAWYESAFGAECVEPLAVGQCPQDDESRTAYQASGVFGEWMQTHFHSREYRFAAAEFGTYNVIRVCRALRAENRAHHHGAAHSKVYQSAKAELLECFCPSDASWRRQVIESGLQIVHQAASALS